MTDASTDAPQGTGPLIDHILTRYHAAHRADLVPLAERVERVHDGDPDAPRGLAQVRLRQDMQDHRTAEETILFPAMRMDGGAGIEHPVAVKRADDDEHAAKIAQILPLTHGLTPQAHAGGSWRSLYRGSARLPDGLAAPVALENGVLFPRSEPAA